jgi:hypothetical protein
MFEVPFDDSNSVNAEGEGNGNSPLRRNLNQPQPGPAGVDEQKRALKQDKRKTAGTEPGCYAVAKTAITEPGRHVNQK